MSSKAYDLVMSWQVLIHPAVENWLLDLSEKDYFSVMAALEVLEEFGPSLGRPFVDTLKDSKFKNLKELRPRGNFIRLIFIFDNRRKAIVLTAGNKAKQWKKWYKINIPIAEKRFERYLEENYG